MQVFGPISSPLLISNALTGQQTLFILTIPGGPGGPASPLSPYKRKNNFSILKIILYF